MASIHYANVHTEQGEVVLTGTTDSVNNIVYGSATTYATPFLVFTQDPKQEHWYVCSDWYVCERCKQIVHRFNTARGKGKHGCS